ncbi:unnamed protein product [Urochloa decumbens]|uniref:Replication factor A C-terminal domain-containing protein n=1 Tax=Urochloa decumbens TaxID=240449 RepID=A0ABC8XL88_9POAL
MVYTLLPDLHPNDHYATICVRVTRKWEYRGVSDDGEPQHVDLVIADHKANVMYAEIPQEMVHAFNNQIQEGEIYEIRRFRVTNAKSLYKPVDGHCMIKFTVHTLVTEPDKPPTTYPRYTYRLTAFEELPMLVGNVQNFIDVLGIIVEISEVEMIQPTNNQPAAPTRKLILMDISGLQAQLTLWGQRATQFNVDGVYNNEEAKAVVGLFVGCLVKSYRGQDYLSGSSACKWYFNPEIPEAEEFYGRYASERVEIRRVAPAPPQAVQPQHPPQQETRYLRELIAIDPYEFPQGGCRCTVTIARLVPDISWWFPSCVRCGKTCTPDPSGYICHACNNNTYRHKYKLVFVASDGTAEAEMICFGQIGQRIVGKPVEQVMRTVRRNEEFPPDIAGIVSQKYTFTVTVANQSFYTRNRSFMVCSIIASYGRQRAIPQAAASSSSRRPSNPRDPAASFSAKNTMNSETRHTPPVRTHHHATPRGSPTTEILQKDAPPLDLLETPETHSARKRLTYDASEDDEESGSEHPKRSRFAKMKGVAEIAENQPPSNLPTKSSSPDPNKASTIRITEQKTSRSQKNK